MAKRRGHNEGSISQLSDGRWQARIDLGHVNGKRVRKAYYGATREDAAQKLVSALSDHQRGLPLPSERLTLEAFLNQWLKDTVAPSVRPKTRVSYEQVCNLHLIPGLGKHPLARLTPAHVQSFLRAKSEAKRSPKADSTLSPTTVRYIRTVLRIALGQAEDWGLVARNVASLVKPPQAVRHEVKPLTIGAAKKLLGALDGHPYEALVMVALALGLREGEALGLSWGDIDFDRATITVRCQLQRIDGRLALTAPKTEKSKRSLALPRVVAQRLRAHRARQLEARMAAGPYWRDEDDLVFTSSAGGPLHPENVSRNFGRFTERIGIPRRRFHDLRHSCASLLLAQGVSLKEVQETLGHTQLATTSDIYAHLYPEFRKGVAERMDAALGGSQ